MDKKTCPYCLGNVENGVIRAGYSSTLWWLPRGMFFSPFVYYSPYVRKKGGVIFSSNLLEVNVKADYCKACNFMYINGHENEAEYETINEQMQRGIKAQTKLKTNTNIIQNSDCPFCNGELEDGYIRVAKSSKLWWLPMGLKITATDWIGDQMIKKGGVVFNNGPLVIDLRSRYCRSCHYIFVNGESNDAKYQHEIK